MKRCERNLKVGVMNEFSACNCTKNMSNNAKRVVMRMNDVAYPIPRVNIANISKAGQGTATDDKGKYFLNADPADKIQFSHIGFKTVTMLYRDIPEVLEMEEVAEMLEEVVVVGSNVQTQPSKNSQLKKAGRWIGGAAIALGLIMLFKKDDKKKKDK